MEFCHDNLTDKLNRCTNLFSSAMLYIVQLLSLHISDSKQAILLNISIVALEAYMPLQLYYFLISHRQ